MIPTREESKWLLSTFGKMVIKEPGHVGRCYARDLPMFKAILALIESKRTVMRAVVSTILRNIETWEKEDWGTMTWGEYVIHKLAELGYQIEDKGDVPVISEEGFSNEEKP